MRLIDADKLIKGIKELWDYKTVDGITATTVLKQTITDIENQPTVKAIPIEWIEKWLDKTTGTKDGDDISQLPEQLKFAIGMINLMEMEWEKENGAKESNRNTGI